jgi:hypothetical protein
MTKTLDDALSTPGIEPETYEIDGEFVYLASTEPGILIDGIVTAKTLRAIADHLEPQAVVVPGGWALVPTADTINDLDPGCSVGEYVSEAARCCGGIAWDIYKGILERVPAPPALRTEAEIRREALEEAAKACFDWIESYHFGSTGPACEKHEAAATCADAIRALIGKEPRV